MKYIGIVFVLLLFVACNAPKVVYDYDKNQDFTTYKSYNFYPELKTGLSEFDDKRLIRQADSILQSRGFVRNATPDFYINVIVSNFEPDRTSAVGVGVGGGGRSGGGGISVGLPIGGSKLNQQLIFDFIDVRKDELFWQAVAEGYYKEKATPEEHEAYFRAILLKVLEGYPPKK